MNKLASQLAGGKSFKLYPEIRYFDFDQYIPNIPSQYEAAIRRRLSWNRPKRSWHFDCLAESCKDVFYYGALGYTETDYKLSAMVRHGLLSRNEAMDQLLIARKELIDSKEKTIELMRQLGIEHLIFQMENFYRNSHFLSEK